MKIINIYNGFLSEDHQGGGVRYLKNLIREQKKIGYDVEVICCGKSFTKSKIIDGCKYIYLSKTLTWPVFLLKLFFFITFNRKFYSNKLFHIHRSYFAPALIFTKSPKIFLTIHTKTFHVISSRIKFIKKITPILKKIDNLIINSFIYKISVAGKEAEKNFDNYVLKNRQITLLPPPILLNNTKSIATQKNTILIVGRLSPVKRPLSVIKLISNVRDRDPQFIKNFKFLFIGDGELKTRIINDINKFNLNTNVKLLGNLSYENVIDYYQKCNKSILLSESEISPFVVKESLYFGKPVFTTDVGDIKSYFTNECGVIIPIESPQDNQIEFLDFLKKEYSSSKIKKLMQKHIKLQNDNFRQNLIKFYAD
jgi:glycosyltransferase involved in cell wall biosynthesis